MWFQWLLSSVTVCSICREQPPQQAALTDFKRKPVFKLVYYHRRELSLPMIFSVVQMFLSGIFCVVSREQWKWCFLHRFAILSSECRHPRPTPPSFSSCKIHACHKQVTSAQLDSNEFSWCNPLPRGGLQLQLNQQGFKAIQRGRVSIYSNGHILPKEPKTVSGPVGIVRN